MSEVSSQGVTGEGQRAQGESNMADYEIFELGDVALQSRATIRDAKLA
jgi:hypothetical protein